MADGNYSGVYGQVGKCQSSSQDINQTKEDRSFSRLNKKTGPQICTSRDTLNDIIDALLIYGEESLVFHNETNNHKLAKKRSSKVTFECDFPVSIHDLLTPSEAHWAANPIAPSPCSDPKSPDASGLEEEDETVLTVSDLVALGQMVGRKLNEDDVEHILSQCKDQNDLLDFPQLIEKMEVMTHELQPCTKSELKQAFKIIDQEGKGFITIKQIREMAEKIMPSICSEELESLFDDTLLGEDDSPLRGKNNDDSQKNNGKTQIKDSGDHKNGEGKINAESFIQFIQML